MLCLTEDKWGRIYVATGRGIDRIDATGEITPSRVRHYTEADGLAKGNLIDMFDGNGDLSMANYRIGRKRRGLRGVTMLQRAGLARF